MPTIYQLPQSLINKIAAGEVIERPASVVKELMENAVDAGATRVCVSAAKGGTEMIRVVDNGCGIAADQLPLAVASHATSKLLEADDLFRVGTLGFRGEALASIAEVSWLVVRSRTADSQSGAELDIMGGKPGEVAPCGCPVGTTVEVRNLFFNTPVRRKFLRTPQTEFGHLSEAFSRIALATPQIDFTLEHNDRTLFELSGSESHLERIARFFGRELADHLIWVESDEGEVHLSGYVAHPSHNRGNNRMQYLFLNGRYIRDRSLQHALREAYRGLLPVGRYPIALLKLAMPPEMVDVNVHPTKLEVRFQESSRLYSQLLSTLRTKFLSTDLTVRVESACGDTGGDPSGAHDEAQVGRLRQELVDWAKGEIASWPSPAAAESVLPTVGRQSPLELTRLARSWSPAGAPAGDEPGEPAVEAPASIIDRGEPAAVAGSAVAGSAVSGSAVQIHDRYLVAETDEGLVIIDQHALHERILYELLRERIDAGAMETQNLLVPEPVDLGPAEAAAAVEHRRLLAQLGMKIEPFGGDTVLVAGYPAMLANISPTEVLHALIEQLLSEGKAPDRRDLLDELLHTIACKAAIKAGDRLAPAEITALLEQRHLVDDSHHCPHGRPAALVLTRQELDRRFKRT